MGWLFHHKKHQQNYGFYCLHRLSLNQYIHQHYIDFRMA
ncbi:hypothetical protein BAZSYMB_GCONTIG00765_0 [Bathymodiolus azoricus thioautotrophic gill symbiont]|uniref:Uncharacterized protein n=1 Tax=Bathymodiolus azoricus thioautotrophic gill symbiont TaxID=235205 RepID=A0A1H6MBU4_9GAMM|nr:hypothetical protein BAZSYMB_GCONTIG00765_0 [Bathymodiolus azoricus thioautotrophic gill symbiont]